MNETERMVKQNWDGDLERQSQGCDFYDLSANGPLEVKKGAVSDAQFQEMKGAFENGRVCRVVDVHSEHFLVFKLERIISLTPEQLIIPDDDEPRESDLNVTELPSTHRCPICDSTLVLLTYKSEPTTKVNPFCKGCRGCLPFLEVTMTDEGLEIEVNNRLMRKCLNLRWPNKIRLPDGTVLPNLTMDTMRKLL